MVDVLADYDAECDVLYLSVGEPEANALSFEDENGLIWRQTPEGVWSGVTVPDLKYFWGGREGELQRLLAARLPVTSIPGLVSA